MAREALWFFSFKSFMRGAFYALLPFTSQCHHSAFSVSVRKALNDHLCGCSSLGQEMRASWILGDLREMSDHRGPSPFIRMIIEAFTTFSFVSQNMGVPSC